MDKNEYLKLGKSRLHNRNSKKLLLNQINNFYDIVDNCKPRKHKYKVGDLVKLKKGTLLHGTWKNIEGLEYISKHGLITGQFKGGREGKYLYTVGVWNLKTDMLLKDYIDFYSGGTIKYFFRGKDGKEGYSKQKIIPFNEMKTLLGWLKKEGANTWYMEQTKEARFMPSLAQNFVQVGIIIDGNSKYAKFLKQGDILDLKISNKDAKEFVHPEVYEKFFVPNRKNKDLFFTDRESAILFGIPPVLIEGILVGRKYEKSKKMLKKIKELLPKAYICNLDGKVVME